MCRLAHPRRCGTLGLTVRCSGSTLSGGSSCQPMRPSADSNRPLFSAVPETAECRPGQLPEIGEAGVSPSSSNSKSWCIECAVHSLYSPGKRWGLGVPSRLYGAGSGLGLLMKVSQLFLFLGSVSQLLVVEESVSTSFLFFSFFLPPSLPPFLSLRDN